MPEGGIEFLELLSVALMSGLKFVLGVGLAIAWGFGFTVSVVTTFVGGVIGVVVYIFFGDFVRRQIRRFFPPKRRITKGRRRVVSLKRGVRVPFFNTVRIDGIWVIAFFTPLILSIPLGTLASVSLGYPWQRILVSMSLSIAFWALILFGLYEIIGIDVHKLLQDAL